MATAGTDVPRAPSRRWRSRAAAGGSPPATGRRRGPRRRRQVLPYGLVLPAVVLFTGVLGYPLLKVVELSFQQYGLREFLTRSTDWIGIQNYRYIFGSDFFWTALVRSLLFVVANVGLTIVVGMLVALLMRRISPWLRTMVSVGMVMAWVMPSVTAAIVWKWMFETQYGVINWILTHTGIGNFTTTDWFGKSPLLAFSIITLMIVWQAVPFVALSLYAGLTQIPIEYYEAARVDGASAWRTFRTITLPMLKPILLLLTILSTIWDFSVFNQIWVMTEGGPNKGTVTLGIWSYVEAFGVGQFGRGAAIAVVSVLLLGAITAYLIARMLRSGDFR